VSTSRKIFVAATIALALIGMAARAFEQPKSPPAVYAANADAELLW
jgi:hypothetical protein